MGLFSTLSKNIHHGGVKLVADAPGSVSIQGPTLPITVTLTSSEAAAIKSIKAELLATPLNMSYNAAGETPQQLSQNQSQIRVVAYNQLNEPFTMAPGETKTLPISIVMNAGNNAANNSGDNQAMAAVAKAAGELETLSSLFNPGAYKYSLKVTADVEGVALNPSDTRGISVNAPGQFGSTTNIRL